MAARKTWLGGLVDSLIFICTEYTKTLLREALLLASRVLNLWLTFLLYIFFSHNNYEVTCYTPPHLLQEPDASKNSNNFEALPSTRKKNLLKQELERMMKQTTPPTSPKTAFPSAATTEQVSKNQNKQSVIPDENVATMVEPQLVTHHPSIWDMFVVLIKWTLRLLWLAPSLICCSKRDRKRSKSFAALDNWSVAQKKSTGLLEDLLVAVLLFVDKMGKVARLIVRFYWREAFVTLQSAFQLFKPSKFLSKEGIDQRSLREVIVDDGYPYERIKVETKDGYMLRLDRIPKKSRTVVYFQHGILDSAFCWIANGTDLSIAYRAFDTLGVDVFMGLSNRILYYV